MARIGWTRRTSGLLVTILTLATEAAAETITVTSGQLLWTGRFGRLDATGDHDFALVGGVVDRLGETRT